MTNTADKFSLLESLTPKQERLMEEVAQEYIRDLTVPREPDMVIIEKWLAIAYGLYDLQVPERIEIVASPEAACLLASELTGDKIDSLDWCGTGDGGWVSFYDFFTRIGVLSAEESADVLALRDFGRVAWDSILLDECAIVVRRPTAMRLDDRGNLHSTTGPCIEWADGEKDYAYHGTWMPEKVILGAKSYSAKEYLALSNTEQRRAVGEIIGWPKLLEMLGATSVDRWTDAATGLAYELMRTSDGAKFLRKLSPSLKDGSQPSYVEPVHEELRTARAARKWQATRLTAAQCESDPELSYDVEA
jgi:hypothetical protein